MRDFPGTRTLRRTWPAAMAATLLAAVCTVPAGTALARSASDANPGHRHAKKQSEAARRRAELKKKAEQKARLILSSSYIRRAQAAGIVVPFTLRLRRSYEAFPGDDQLQLAWDTSTTPWPLAGTAPVAPPPITYLDGATSFWWDYGADTSGYGQLGTVETQIGANTSMTGSGFHVAVADGSTCTTLQALDVTGISITSAGMRFGTLNPFSGVVNGTLSMRVSTRALPTTCGGGSTTPASALSTPQDTDPPLPIAFSGRFTVSPSIAADGSVRLGVLRIADTPQTPQRSVFGYIHACTDPAAADGCARMAFPVRTKILNLTAEVVAGDKMPAPPAAP
jgi:hypothetical protein